VKQNSKISIVIPTYNAGSTLEHCLNSIVSQTYKAFEVFIIDGVSTDNTKEIIRSYANEYHYVCGFIGKDSGIYDAMNKGLRLAKGEWIYFMGSDDRLVNKFVLANISKHLNEHADIVYGNTIWLPDNVVESGESTHLKHLYRCVNHQRIFYRAELFKRLGQYNTKYPLASDYELNIRFFCNPTIVKKYVDLSIAFFNSNGLSSLNIDEVFWDDFKYVVLNKFSPYLSYKEIYTRLNFYCWFKIRKKNYSNGFRLFCQIFVYTRSFSFVRHSVSQLIKSFKE
jgi:glycosyltransferase involved in cell wall biosynthesis